MTNYLFILKNFSWHFKIGIRENSRRCKRRRRIMWTHLSPKKNKKQNGMVYYQVTTQKLATSIEITSIFIQFVLKLLESNMFCFVGIIIYCFRFFHISIGWWFFTGVWVTTSLLKSPILFLVFCPSSIILSFGWSPLRRQLPNPPDPLIIL